MMTTLARGPVVFAIGSSQPFGKRVSAHLGMELGALEERSFEDGEHKIRPLINVRNRDVYVIHSLDGDTDQSANDKLCRMLFLIGALKDAAAARVTAIAPYLCYSRKDRQTKPRDPVTSRYVAQLFEAVGADRVITMEVHNLAAFQNAFRCDTEHLNASAIFAGDVAGRSVIVIDDLISTGGTMARMAAACREHGAAKVYLAATHGLFSDHAGETLAAAAVNQIVVTDSVAPRPLVSDRLKERLVVLSVAGVFAEAIRRCHTGESILELLGEDEPSAQ
jgi:ribose-phosphate pyrophosphokinase